MERHFLVVAANGKVREELAACLRRQSVKVTLAENGSQAERAFQAVNIETVVIESHLPDTSGTALRERLLEIRPECQIVVLTSFSLVRNTPDVLRFGASDFLVRADQIFSIVRPAREDESAFTSWSQPATQSLIGVIDTLVGLLELDSQRFGSTSHVATRLARATAEELHSGEDMMFEVVLGTLLRDVGKTGLEVDVALTENMTEEERNRHIEEHVTGSLRLLEHIGFPWKVLSTVRHHHEWYDGTGAPDGLRGREIPMASRIVALVDGYVALTTRKGDDSMSPDDALQVIASRTGRQFDPEVVEAFLRVIDKQLAGRRSKGKPTVVLVDHDAQFRRVLKVRLGNVGLKVQEAPDFELCKEQLLKTPPDLALVGIDTDVKEAFHLLQEMQQDENLCRIPVAFLSAAADRVIKIRALRQGVDDFLSKSDDMDELVARIENIMVRGAIRAEGEARRARRGVSGSLENLGLPDIVQTLAIGMKTACVTLTIEDRSGRIWFESGTPSHAECGPLDGEEAFYEMVRWQDGEFVIEHGAKPRRSSIQRDGMFLLMEGLRMIDEAGQPAS